jgi:beta-glucosidase
MRVAIWIWNLAYVDHLVALVKEGKVKESLVDDAARRILKVSLNSACLMIHTNIVMKIEELTTVGKPEFQEVVLHGKNRLFSKTTRICST